MFTIKATYRGETRKFGFSESNSFPSFDQLYHQLYRVFPISSNFTLCQLLFLPNSNHQSRILLSKEVRNEADYIDCIAQFSGRTWPNPLLKFTVSDDTPHKAPAVQPVPVPSQVFPISHIPPPPIIYSAHVPTIPSAMDVDPPFTSRTPKPTSAPCCPVAECKREVHSLLINFQEDLTRLVTNTFGSTNHGASNQAMGISTTAAPSASMACSRCLVPCQRMWYECDMCHIVLCAGCKVHDDQTDIGKFRCYSTFGAHIMTAKGGCPYTAPSASSTSSRSFPVPSLAPSPYAPNGSAQGASPTSGGSFIPPTPGAPGSSLLDPPQTSVHVGVYCDMCDSLIHGVRHKCADCPDYDLCTPCYDGGAPDRHNPFHVFIDIQKPRTTSGPPPVGRYGALNAASSPSQAELPAHYATCDLCESRIRGDRFKCVVCPDFDTCGSCFSITGDQHPHHSFVRISKPSDYILRGRAHANAHMATCNECAKVIHGVRYKCLHPSCPDYDLCANCEALPIAIHPETHPLLKIKTPDTTIPRIARSEESTLQAQYDREVVQPEPSPTALSFNHGFMRNPYLNLAHSAPSSPAPSVKLDLTTPARSPSPASSIINFNQPSSPTFFPPRTPSPAPRPLNEYSPVFRAPSPLPLVELETDQASNVPANTNTASVRPASRASSLPPLWHRFSTLTVSEENLSNTDNTVAPLIDTDNTATKSYSPTSPSTAKPADTEATTPAASPAWPGVASGLQHLLGPTVAKVEVESQTTRAQQESETGQLADEPANPFSLSSFLSTRNSFKALEEQIATKLKIQLPIESSLRAGFVDDVTVPDGQVFPPGAEFVKCWKMTNTGEHAWPETTELVFVAGESLGYSQGVKIGVVEPGKTVELSTSELKAPETPGRYMSYWKLRSNGHVFGDSIWIDLTVADERSNESLASSAIIMPTALPSQGALSVVEVSPTDASGPSIPTTEVDQHSDEGSIISFVSSRLSSIEGDDAAWEEAQNQAQEDADFVVLLDERSASE